MTMLTKWGAALDCEHPLPEYPRPQLRRESFLNLNGVWDYAVTASGDEPVDVSVGSTRSESAQLSIARASGVNGTSCVPEAPNETAAKLECA